MSDLVLLTTLLLTPVLEEPVHEPTIHELVQDMVDNNNRILDTLVKYDERLNKIEDAVL